MFRGIVKGLGELFKKRGSVEMSELPKASTAVQQALGQNQPPPIQPSSQQNVSVANSSAAATQNTFRRSSTANSMAKLSSSIGSTPSQFAEAKTSKLLSTDDFVRVRIWTSKTKDGLDTYAANAILQSGNVGHATLETKNIYASFWPERGVSSLKEEVASEYVGAVQTDMARESIGQSAPKEPDYTFEFYSLNVKAIEEKFKEIKESKEPLSWTLFGNSLNEKGYSCSSLTLSLLEVGGLNNLASQKIRGIISPTSNFVSSPNNLLNQLSYASRIESYKHPEVLDFDLSKNSAQRKEPFVITIKAGVARITNKDIVNNLEEAVFKPRK